MGIVEKDKKYATLWEREVTQGWVESPGQTTGFSYTNVNKHKDIFWGRAH